MADINVFYDINFTFRGGQRAERLVLDSIPSIGDWVRLRRRPISICLTNEAFYMYIQGCTKSLLAAFIAGLPLRSSEKIDLCPMAEIGLYVKYKRVCKKRLLDVLTEKLPLNRLQKNDLCAMTANDLRAQLWPEIPNLNHPGEFAKEFLEKVGEVIQTRA